MQRSSTSNVKSGIGKRCKMRKKGAKNAEYWWSNPGKRGKKKIASGGKR